MKKGIRESVIENNLVRAVAKRGGFTYKLDPIGRAGKPDRLVILPNKLIFVECKAPGKKPRPEQLREHERLTALGHKVFVLDSTDVDFLDE